VEEICCKIARFGLKHLEVEPKLCPKLRKTHGRDILMQINESSPMFLMDAVTTINAALDEKKRSTSTAETSSLSKKAKTASMSDEVLDTKMSPICAIQRADTQQVEVFNGFREIKAKHPQLDLHPLITSHSFSCHEESPFAVTFYEKLWIDKAFHEEDWCHLCECVPVIEKETQECGSSNPVIVENQATGA